MINLFNNKLFASFTLSLFAMANAAVADEPQAGAETASITAQRGDFQFEGLRDLPVFILRPQTLRPEGHKVLIYFTGGGQTEDQAQAMLNSHIALEAVRRGYVFASPAAPCRDCTFVARGEDYFPQLFDTLRNIFPMSEDRFHLMGFSNGGRSSFHIATRHPDQVASVTTYPGYLRNKKYSLLGTLSDTCVVMYVGRKDDGFFSLHGRVVRELKKLGRPVHHEEFSREGHNIKQLWTEEGARKLMDGVDNRLRCPESSLIE